jgi:hypothetical protein
VAEKKEKKIIIKKGLTESRKSLILFGSGERI